jgi:hypothetical protein
MPWHGTSAILRLAAQSSPSYQAAFSTLERRAGKARPVSAFTTAEIAIQRMLPWKRNKPKWPQPRSVLHGIHGKINGTAVFASAASETSVNVISEAFARDCELDISPYTQSLQIANNTTATPIGSTTAVWSFKGESFSKSTVEFIVLDSPSRPLILGADFLERTNTIDHNWHRLQTISVPGEDFSCVHILGDRSNSISGKLDSVPVLALAATGSEVNLVSTQFIEESGLASYCKPPMDEHYVKLIDGCSIPIERTIRLNWQYGNDQKFWLAEFVVLPDLMCDVVLGQQFLYGSGAFFKYAHCFESEIPTGCQSGIGFPFTIVLSFAAKKSKSLDVIGILFLLRVL